MASEDVTTRAEQRLAELLRDGRMHLEAMEHEDSHFAGPDPECSACDDIYGEANLLRDLLAEVARLREARIEAFVQGARWWEMDRSGGTMWATDRMRAYGAAESRRLDGTLGLSEQQLMELVQQKKEQAE